MSRVPYTLNDLKKLNLAIVGDKSCNTYSDISKGRKEAKIKKLPPLLKRAIPEHDETGDKIYIKPLSVNDAWKGQRFKTPEYEAYHLALTLMLPKTLAIPTGDLFIRFEWGLSSNAGDWDAPIKQTQDIIARKYRFNDNRIIGGLVIKTIVPKGQEYIKFKIEKYDNQ